MYTYIYSSKGSYWSPGSSWSSVTTALLKKETLSTWSSTLRWSESMCACSSEYFSLSHVQKVCQQLYTCCPQTEHTDSFCMVSTILVHGHAAPAWIVANIASSAYFFLRLRVLFLLNTIFHATESVIESQWKWSLALGTGSIWCVFQWFSFWLPLLEMILKVYWLVPIDCHMGRSMYCNLQVSTLIHKTQLLLVLQCHLPCIVRAQVLYWYALQTFVMYIWRDHVCLTWVLLAWTIIQIVLL